MKKQLIIIGITLVLIIVGFSGCEEELTPTMKNEYSKFYGTWNTNASDGQVWTFRTSKELMVVSNGTTYGVGTFDIRAIGIIWLFNPKVIYNYEFSNNDRKLTLTVDGGSLGHPTALVLTKSGTPPSSSGNPNFYMSNPLVEDNCSAILGNGTVWVNFTIQNIGGSGSKVVYARIYQGIENFQYCPGIFDETKMKTISLNNGQITNVSFVFIGIDCRNGSGCYGSNYWIGE
jgi:hypothetical protein